MQPFGFLTNHGMTLLCIAADPGIRMKEIAAEVDITERATQRIVSDLIEAGYLDRQRVGRRNLYSVKSNLRIAVPNRRDLDLNTLLNVLLPQGSSTARRQAMPTAGTIGGGSDDAESFYTDSERSHSSVAASPAA